MFFTATWTNHRVFQYFVCYLCQICSGLQHDKLEIIYDREILWKSIWIMMNWRDVMREYYDKAQSVSLLDYDKIEEWHLTNCDLSCVKSLDVQLQNLRCWCYAMLILILLLMSIFGVHHWSGPVRIKFPVVIGF